MMDWLLSAQNDAARLPALMWQQGWLHAGWAVVLAWCAVGLASRFTQGRRVKVTLAISAAVWAGWPGPGGAAYWLGLAFQAPSISTVLLCAMWLVRMLSVTADSRSDSRVWSGHALALAVSGVALGWALLLDTLGVFPASLFNWGFSSSAPAMLMTAVLVIRSFQKAAYSTSEVCALALGAFLYLVLRLPSGNVFDAILDPALWVALHIALFHQWRMRIRFKQ